MSVCESACRRLDDWRCGAANGVCGIAIDIVPAIWSWHMLAKMIGIGRDMGMAGMGQDVNGMDNGNATGNGGNGNAKRRLSRSRQRAGFVMIDGDGSKAESSVRSRTATSVSSPGRAAVMSDTDRIIVPPIDSQPSGHDHTDNKQMTSPSRSRQGAGHSTGGSVAPHTSGKHGGAVGKSHGNAQKAVPFDGSNGTGTQNHARNSAVAGTRRGAHGSMTGVRADSNGVVASVPSSTRKGGTTTVSDAERRSGSVTDGGAYVPRSAVDTGVSGRVSGFQGASGSVSHGVHSGAASTVHDDAVVSPSDGGGRSVDADDSAVDDDDVAITSIGFTEAERRLYDETHAPLADRIRWALAESWVPIACVIIIGVTVLLRFLMAFSSAVLTVLAIGVGVILMGSIICITYEDQKKANALADEAEMLYAAKCRIEERAARRKNDAAADDNTDTREAKTKS